MQLPVRYDPQGNPIYDSSVDPFLKVFSSQQEQEKTDGQSQSSMPSTFSPMSDSNDMRQESALNKSIIGPLAKNAPTQNLFTPSYEQPPSANQVEQPQQQQANAVPASIIKPIAQAHVANQALNAGSQLFGGASGGAANAASSGAMQLTPTEMNLFGELQNDAMSYANMGNIPETGIFGLDAPVGTMGQVAGGAGAAYSAYQIGDRLLNNKKDPMGGLMSGAGLGAGLWALGALQPELIPVIIAAGALAGMVGSGGPNKRKQQATALFEGLKEKTKGGTYYGTNGVQLSLEDGGEMDETNPLAGAARAIADPIAEAMVAGFTPKSGGATAGREDVGDIFARSIVNGAKTEDDLYNNMLSLTQSLGVTRDQVLQNLGSKYTTIDPQRMQVYANVLSRMTPLSQKEIMSQIQRYAGVNVTT